MWLNIHRTPRWIAHKFTTSFMPRRINSAITHKSLLQQERRLSTCPAYKRTDRQIVTTSKVTQGYTI